MKTKYRIYIMLLLLTPGIFYGISSLYSYVSRYEANTAESRHDVPGNLAFDKVMDVLSHKRCVNCHPAGEFPKQGEDSHKHLFGVQRGGDNHGVAAVRCNSCHRDQNNDFSGVPGAPHWSVAPKSMAWEGLSRNEIARSLLDRSKNGNRSLEDLEHHLTEDTLVLWVWNPGVDDEGIPREKPPVPREEFIAAVKEWIALGAPVPDK
jgi:hypothetical protein